jgi:hypothetical protein
VRSHGLLNFPDADASRNLRLNGHPGSDLHRSNHRSTDDADAEAPARRRPRCASRRRRLALIAWDSVQAIRDNGGRLGPLRLVMIASTRVCPGCTLQGLAAVSLLKRRLLKPCRNRRPRINDLDMT